MTTDQGGTDAQVTPRGVVLGMLTAISALAGCHGEPGHSPQGLLCFSPDDDGADLVVTLHDGTDRTIRLSREQAAAFEALTAHCA